MDEGGYSLQGLADEKQEGEETVLWLRTMDGAYSASAAPVT